MARITHRLIIECKDAAEYDEFMTYLNGIAITPTKRIDDAGTYIIEYDYVDADYILFKES